MTRRDRGEGMGSVRWAFRCGSWTPSRSEWLFAARCVQLEEKDRIGQFVFAKDAKSAMAGRLLLRKFVCERMGIPWSQIRLERSPRGKPYLAPPSQVTADFDPSWSFNLSHQGDYAVLAAQQGVQVGVDVMKTTMPGSNSIPEFFRIMTRQFTAHEWSTIQSVGSEHQQLAAFYRHWTLKESFIKAIGTGLGFNLQRAEFHLSPELLTQGMVLHQTKMHLDEEPEELWVFEESLLDADHHVAVALGPADRAVSMPLPAPATFTLLSFSELIASASPLTEEDPAYWDSFRMKAEAPQRQRNT
ncbi:LOW QUALITY PROTEIN: L-aminoadipate-semialdehyde dehydrogenase-phosphopantetheinyl transferase [Anableps anableps]